MTNTLTEAIKSTIMAHADWSYCGWRPAQIHWHTEPEYITANQCPAICIIYRDSRTVAETLRGRYADGTCAPGLAVIDYLFDIHLWDKAAKLDELAERLHAAGDVVRAALQDGFNLDGYPVYAHIDRGSQTESFRQGSAQLAALPLQLSVTVYGRQGSPTVPPVEQ